VNVYYSAAMFVGLSTKETLWIYAALYFLDFSER